MIRSLLIALGILLAAGSAQAADKVVLMLNWYVYGEHTPFFYGKAKGFYADQGIDLEIQEGRGSAMTAQAVAAGTVGFGYFDVPTMIKAAAKGAPLVSVGVLLQKSPMSVMGFTDKAITKPEDIKGKTVATTPGDSLSQIWPFFLQKTGLKESDFKTVSGDAQTKLNAVINGQADLLLGYAMDQSMKIKDALLHAAGELPGQLGLEPLQPDHAQQMAGALQMRGAGQFLDLGRHHDVGQDVAPRQQQRVLEHDAGVAMRPVDRAAAQPDPAGAGRQQAGDHAQQRGLAAAGRADQHQELALVDGEVQRRQRRHLAVAAAIGLRHALDGDDGGRRHPRRLDQMKPCSAHLGRKSLV
jgi:hypothetical protein